LCGLRPPDLWQITPAELEEITKAFWIQENNRAVSVAWYASKMLGFGKGMPALDSLLMDFVKISKSSGEENEIGKEELEAIFGD
jgi:hypothetical protein